MGILLAEGAEGERSRNPLGDEGNEELGVFCHLFGPQGWWGSGDLTPNPGDMGWVKLNPGLNCPLG